MAKANTKKWESGALIIYIAGIIILQSQIGFLGAIGALLMVGGFKLISKSK